MYKFILSLFIAAFALGACSEQSSVVAPTKSDGSSSLSLTKSQEGELTDMLILGEDPSAIIPSAKSADLSLFLFDVAPCLARDGRPDARRFADIAAIMYFRAALMSDSTVTDEQKSAIKSAIDSSTAIRAAIFMDTTLTSSDRAAALKAEHDRLMALIAGAGGTGGILTADQVSKTDALLAQIEAERKLHHAEMLERRIAALISKWSSVLTLTDSQKALIADLLRAQDADIETARAQNQYDPEGFRTAALAIQVATQQAIRDVLTDTQKPLWDQIVASHWTGWTDGGRGPGMGGHGGHHGRHG